MGISAYSHFLINHQTYYILFIIFILKILCYIVLSILFFVFIL